MALSSVMVHLDLERPNDACLRIVVDLATQFDTRLIGVAAAAVPSFYYRQPASAQELAEHARKEIAGQLAKAEDTFRIAMRGCAGKFEWRSAVADATSFLVTQARASDLIVTNALRDRSYADLLGKVDPADLVVLAGRPVLVVPPQAEHLEFNCAMVAWKETREARRAVIDALPLLQKVREVVVAEVIDNEADRLIAHAHLDDVISWLKGHGIAADSRVFLFPEREDSVDKLWEYGADFIVAGAYGHAPLREWILGGFTEKFLRRSPRCIFLSH